MNSINLKTPAMGQIATESKSQDKYFLKKNNIVSSPPTVVLKAGEYINEPHLEKRPTKKALLKREKRRLQILEFQKNQRITDEILKRERAAKFNRNFTSPDRQRKLLEEVRLDHQSGWLDSKHKVSLDEGLMADVHSIGESLHSGVNMTHTFDGKFTNVFSKFNNTLEELSRKIPNLNPLSGDFSIPQLGSAVSSSMMSNLMDMSSYGLALYLIYAMFEHEDKRNKKTCGALIVVLTIILMRSDFSVYSLCKDKITSCLQGLISLFKRDEEVSEMEKVPLDTQMGAANLDAILDLSSVYIFSKIVGKAPEGEMTQKLFKEVGSFKRSKEGIKDLTSTVLGFVEKIVNWVRVHILDLSSVTLIESDVLEVKGFVTECMLIADLCHKNKFHLSIPNSDVIHNLWTKGNKLLDKYSRRDTSELRLQVQNQMTYISKVRARFVEANLLTMGTRQAPLCVLIRGPSGVGKSASTVPLVTSLLSMILPDEELNDFRANYESFIYGRQSEQCYWDGYRGQFVCAFDDFGQLKDVAGQGENEFSEFIRAGNIFGYILHMADIESKGGVAFRSKIVVCTTNLRKIDPNSIVEREALIRRFDVIVDQVPPEQFCIPETLTSGDIWNRRLDVSKVEEGFDERACEYHEVKFDKDGSHEGKRTGRIFTYDELVGRLTMLYERRAKQATSYKIALEKNVEKYERKREEKKYTDALELQMDLDHHFGPAEDPEETRSDGFFAVTDSTVLAFIARGHFHPKFKDVIELVEALKVKIGVGYLDKLELFEQLIQGSKVMYARVKNWVENQDSLGSPEFDKIVVEMQVYMNHILASDEICKTVYEGLRISIKSSVVHGWAAASERFMTFIGEFFGKVKAVLSRFPQLEWWRNAIPYGDFILGALSLVAASSFAVYAVKKAIDGILMFINYIFPGFSECVDVEICPRCNGCDPYCCYNFDEGQNPKRRAVCKGPSSTHSSAAHGARKKMCDYGLDYSDQEHKKMIETRELRFSTQSAPKPRPKHGVTKAFIRSVRDKSKFSPVLEAQLGSTDPVLDQIMTKVIENNSYELWPTSTRKAGYITFIKGRVALMPWHFVTELAAQIAEEPGREDDYCELRKARSSVVFTVPLVTLLEAVRATNFESQDACLVMFPRNVKNHLDITKYFHSERTANMRRDKKFVLYSPNQERISEFHGESYQVVQNTPVGLIPESMTYVRTGFRYTATTTKGDCGSLMCAVDSSSGREKIIGIHTGGNSSAAQGFSTAVCREDLLETLDLFKDEVVTTLFETQPELEYNSNFVMLDGRFVTIGTSERVVRANEFTAIGPSRLIGKWQPEITIPGRLKPFKNDEGDLIDPFKVGLAKYCKKHVHIDSGLMDLIGTHILEDMKRVSSIDVEKKILTFDEAVVGIENENDYGSLPRGTSAGYPHNTENDKRPGKTKWFGADAVFDLNTEACQKLRTDVSKIIEDAKWNTRHPFFYCDYLKDERRTHEKYEKGNTRIFSACPLEYTITVRQYFGSFCLWVTKNKIHNGSAIGVNPYSYDWQTIAEQLKKYGDKVGAGDYKGFDGSEQPEIHWPILDIINNWYDDGPENKQIRNILWLELVNSRHIRGNLVYEWVSSLPSGHPLTTMVNILYGFFAFRYCWFRAHDNNEGCLFEFPKHVFLIELGDDNIYNFSDECSDKFNQETISRFMAEIGLTYTDEDKKTGSMIKWRKLEECTFLKRGFRVEKSLDRYVGPLALDSILESPYWTTTNSQKDLITKTTTETSLMELALHEQETWDLWAPKIIKAYDENYWDKLDLTNRRLLIQKSVNSDTFW